jgi:CRISPR-associated protein Cas1
MRSLYIMTPGSSLHKDGRTLKIKQNGELVQTIPADNLEHLALAGRCSISGQVLDFLINQRIDTIFMTLEGRFRGRLLLDESGHVALRRQQYLSLDDGEFARRQAVAIVGRKLENQARLLLQRTEKDSAEVLRGLGAQIKALRKRLAEVDSLDKIRGVEGYGSRLFFSGFGLLIKNERFRFTGRNRRPPRDPVNGMLSFVYTLLTNEVNNGLKSCGLDPYLGALHEIAPGRPSLACDLVEEWRAFGERLVLTLINRQVVRPEDFVYRKEGQRADGQLPVEMKPAMLRALISSYHRLLETVYHYPATGQQTRLRWIIHGQCRRFAEALEKKTVYDPFPLPR